MKYVSLDHWIQNLLQQSPEMLDRRYASQYSAHTEVASFLGQARLNTADQVRTVPTASLEELHYGIRGSACESEIWDAVIAYCAHPLPAAIAHDLLDRNIAMGRLGHSRQVDEVQWRMAGFYSEAILTLALDLYTNPGYSAEDLQKLLQMHPTHDWMLETLSLRNPSSEEKRALYLAVAARHPKGAKLLHQQQVTHGVARTRDPALDLAELTMLYRTQEPKVLEALAGATEALKNALHNGEEDVRIWAARLLHRWAGSSVAPVPLWQAALADESAQVRHIAALTLHKLGVTPGPPVEALLHMAADPDGEIRRATAGALGQIEDTRATGALISMLADPDQEVRAKAAYALGRFGDRRALQVLEQMEEPARNKMVLRAVRESIVHIKKRLGEFAPARKADQEEA